jgi:hypothetical protein
MDIRYITPQAVKITLSRRNLETLLKMLDANVGTTALHRSVKFSPDDLKLIVQAEENEHHYGARVPGVGPEDI